MLYAYTGSAYVQWSMPGVKPSVALSETCLLRVSVVSPNVTCHDDAGRKGSCKSKGCCRKGLALQSPLLGHQAIDDWFGILGWHKRTRAPSKTSKTLQKPQRRSQLPGPSDDKLANDIFVHTLAHGC
jgi:hypothetical protein